MHFFSAASPLLLLLQHAWLSASLSVFCTGAFQSFAQGLSVHHLLIECVCGGARCPHDARCSQHAMQHY